MILSVSNLIISGTLIVNSIAVSNFPLNRSDRATSQTSVQYNNSSESQELSQIIQLRVQKLIYRIRKLGILLAVWNLFVVVLMIVFFPEE
mmetsp:Transcript_27651/g.36280  ORF Transcript_27651/g.36280 Transcript_27651/m.36280 type:complete len:90 (+) Transcript_27651:188-457(+)